MYVINFYGRNVEESDAFNTHYTINVDQIVMIKDNKDERFIIVTANSGSFLAGKTPKFTKLSDGVPITFIQFTGKLMPENEEERMCLTLIRQDQFIMHYQKSHNQKSSDKFIYQTKLGQFIANDNHQNVVQVTDGYAFDYTVSNQFL